LFFKRVDLGECAKVHEYALRADYERAAATKNLYYELDVKLTIVLLLIKRNFWF
jgi:hypothetical protein